MSDKILDFEPVQEDAIENYSEFDYLTDFYLPFQDQEIKYQSDILKGLNLFKKGSFSMVMSVSIKESNSLKYGFLNNNKFSSVNEPKFCFANRQQLPNLYAPNGAVYIFGSNSFIENKDFPTSSIGAFEMPVSRSIDIDKESDLEIIKKLNFNYDYGKK